MAAKSLEPAMALHRAGRLREAEAAYRRALAVDPGNPDALHFLGLIAHQTGRHEEGARLIREAIAGQPSAVYWYNLGHIHLALSDMPAAEAAFRQAITLDARHAEALFHFARICAATGDTADAIACYRRAIDARPDFVDARVNLALLLKDGGEPEEAIAQLEEACRLRPADANIRNNLGIVRRAAAPARAVDDFRQALALKPDHTEAKINLAKALSAMARHAEAIEILREIQARRPDDAEICMLLGHALGESNHLEAAVQQYEQVIGANPQSARPLVALGNLYLRFGRFDEAHASYLRSRSLDPTNCDAAAALLKHLTSRVSPREAEEIARLAGDPALATAQRRQLHFALSAYLESQGDYDAAFRHMDEANRLRRIELEAQGRSFDLAKYVARVDSIIETFNEAYLRRMKGFGVASELPVFIVGMPRSGTTLCEQILASHSQVFGAGELNAMAQIERELRGRGGSGRDFASYARRLSAEIVQAKARDHLAWLQRLAPDALRIVDKLPMNYERLGLIATLFPQARVIHCRRNPLDVGFSCYSKDFASALPWACDLQAIGQVHRQHERLMAHWRRVLAIEILDLPYEDVVSCFERRAQQLIAHCGLVWEPACLCFHESDRPVRTASLEQVRRPLYDTSIGRCRKFEQHLTQLAAAVCLH